MLPKAVIIGELLHSQVLLDKLFTALEVTILLIGDLKWQQVGHIKLNLAGKEKIQTAAILKDGVYSMRMHKIGGG